MSIPSNEHLNHFPAHLGIKYQKYKMKLDKLNDKKCFTQVTTHYRVIIIQKKVSINYKNTPNNVVNMCMHNKI